MWHFAVISLKKEVREELIIWSEKLIYVVYKKSIKFFMLRDKNIKNNDKTSNLYLKF